MSGKEFDRLKEAREIIAELQKSINDANDFELWMIKNLLEYLIEEIKREERRRELADILGIDILA